jgi:hypothetical protein
MTNKEDADLFECVIKGRRILMRLHSGHATILGDVSGDVVKPEIEGQIIKKIAANEFLIDAREHYKNLYSETIKRIERSERNRVDQRFSPPALGESLLVLFCPANRADAVLGDLAEQFEIEVQKKGIKRATLLYWTRAIRSFGPLLTAKLRNTGIWLSVIEIGRRWIGS